MKIRLHGTADECSEVAERLAGVVDALAVSEPYPDRGASVLVRVYVEVRLAPLVPPACEDLGCVPGGPHFCSLEESR
jgi:hypothetical protein